MTIRTFARPAGGKPLRAEVRPRHFLAGLLFAALLLAYAASPVRTSFDSRWSVHTAMSFLRGHSGALDEYAPVLNAETQYAIVTLHHRPYGYFPIGTSVLSAPAVLLASLIHPRFNDYLRHHIPARFEGLIASLYGALAGVAFFHLLRDRFPSWPVTAWATAIFCFATSMWSTATRALWQHGPLVLMLTVAMLILLRARGRPSLISYLGVPLAAAFVIRPTAAIPIAVLSLYVLAAHRRWFLPYLAGAAVIAIPWLAFNVWLFGDWLPPYYFPARVTGSPTIGPALLGNLLSPGRGLFVFSPILLAALPGFALSLRQRNDRALHGAFATIVVLHWLFVSRFPHWWGGYSFGPRLMSDILPFITYFAAFALQAALAQRHGPRRALNLCVLAAATLLSMVIHAQGALSWAPYAWNTLPTSIDEQPSRLWQWSNPQFAQGLLATAAMPDFGDLLPGTDTECTPATLRNAAFTGKGGIGRNCLAGGWSGPEPWGTWSLGPAASIEITLGPQVQPGTAYTLVATASALVTPTRTQNDVEVFLGGTSLTRWHFTTAGAQTFTVPIPASHIHPGAILDITLHPADYRSPAALGLSVDTRPIGVGLVTLSFIPASGPDGEAR